MYRQGELARNFYIILSGEVEVVREQDGQESVVVNLGAGEYFGGRSETPQPSLIF